MVWPSLPVHAVVLYAGRDRASVLISFSDLTAERPR